MTHRHRVLALSFFPAFVPPNNGGVERLYNFYAELSQHHDVTLLSSGFLDGQREVVRHRSSFTEIRIPKDRHFADVYASLAGVGAEGDVSGPALGKSLAGIGALHDEYLEHYASSDIIMHDSPFLVEVDLFRGFDSKLRIYNSYNCETDLYSSFHSNERAQSVIPALVKELEADLCRHSDLITVCSDEDEAAFRKHFDPIAPIVRVPNGYVPGHHVGQTKRERRSLVFIGSAHKPNLDAARMIVDHIAPKMRDVDFHLIGSCQSQGQQRNVTAHGVISQQEKQTLLRSATAALNPMASGGGSSLKIADIASEHCPLISTDFGARGFDLERETHYVLLDLADPVGSIRDALGRPQVLEAVAEAAAAHVEQFYSWRGIVSAFVALLETLVPGKVAKQPARLVINDYDSFGSTGGGATRTRGLCQGLSESASLIFLAFANDNVPRRRVSDDGKILSLLVDRSPAQIDHHARDNRLHWISTADLVAYEHAERNQRLMALFRCGASVSSVIICEHPYMVGLPRAFGVDFVYSSQNVELNLKAEGLKSHPERDCLLELAHEAESYACANSSFVVAVASADAHELGANYRSTAPILVIPNGSEGAAADAVRQKPEGQHRPVAIFMGSAHGPNYEAAQWIVNELALAARDWDFVIIGSVVDSIGESIADNVRLLGEVSATEKTAQLYAAQVALNPMISGSGSNVKMADYLQHGLPVLTTRFGRRGYETVSDGDAVVAEREDFAQQLAKLAGSELVGSPAQVKRQAAFASQFAMDAGGRRLAQLIERHAGKRKRALYVTYRYNEPARGGGEEYVNRLVHALAASGWEVDVVSPAAERIVDRDRFSAAFFGDDHQPVPTGIERVRSRKFPLVAAVDDGAALKRLWNYQSEFERDVASRLVPPAQACLAWGWADGGQAGRWCFRSAGVYLHDAGRITLEARTPGAFWLQVLDQSGHRLFELDGAKNVDVSFDFPAGFLWFQFSMSEAPELADPRPLAAFVTHLAFRGRSLLDDRVADLWNECNSSAATMAALAGARAAVRDPHDLQLSPLRSPSEVLDAHVRECVGNYDLMITHNAVFNSSTAAIAAAKDAGVPSVLIPHLHYDDDFYHFPDIYGACASASKTLVCPRLVEQMLLKQGLDNVSYLSPGVDISMTVTADDIDAFRDVLELSSEGFFLMLGRKAAAKGYGDVIDALDQIPTAKTPTIVMIGADDDGVVIEDPRVRYLGRQPDAVVRGALHACIGLINMSRSESFGMVLLQAGLLAKPVLANRNCAAFADIVEDGANGFLVSRDELAARMTELQTDRKLGQRLGKEGRKRALRYDWRNMERQFIQACEALVGDR